MSQTAALPYSAVRKVGDTLYIAGQIGWDMDTKIAQEGIEAQTHQVMENIERHLKDNGATMSDLVKVTAYLTDMGDFAAFNDAYATHLSDPYPARTCIAVSELPRVANVDLVVEIESIAYVGK